MQQIDERFAKWFKGKLADITDAGPLVLCELFHVVEGETADKLATAQLEDDTDADDLIAELWAQAEHDANTRTSGLQQRYVVQLYRAKSMEVDCSRAFVLNSTMREALMLGNDTEPPTAKGKLAQDMRHQENMHRLLIHMSESSHSRVTAELENALRRANTAETQLLGVMESMQKLQDHAHERDIERMKEEAKERRHEQMLAAIMGLVPSVMAQLMGSKGAHTIADAAMADAAGEFFGGLNPQENMALLEVFAKLEPTNQMKLATFIETVKKRTEQKETDKPQLGKRSNLQEESSDTEPVH